MPRGPLSRSREPLASLLRPDTSRIRGSQSWPTSAVCRCFVGSPLCVGISGTLLITFWNTAGVNSVWFPYFSPLCHCLHASVHQTPSPVETRPPPTAGPECHGDNQ